MPLTPTLTTFYGELHVPATDTDDTSHLFDSVAMDIDGNDNIYVFDRQFSSSGDNEPGRILKISPEKNVSTQVVSLSCE